MAGDEGMITGLADVAIVGVAAGEGTAVGETSLGGVADGAAVVAETDDPGQVGGGEA